MSTACALRRHSNLLVVLLFSALMCGTVASLRPDARVKDSRSLFLLAGTPTNYGDQAFPVTLYRINSDGKLKSVREVVGQKDGLYSVRQADQAIFVAYPHVLPSSVSIIHTDEPLRTDALAFNSRGLTPIQNKEGLSESPGSGVNELFPLVKGSMDPKRGTLVSVSSALEEDQRIQADRWNQYKDFRFDGIPGGFALTAGPFGLLDDQKIRMSIFGRAIDIENVPPLMERTPTGAIAWLMVVSSRYSVLSFADSAPKKSQEPPSRDREMFVHDRYEDQWRRIKIEGTRPRLRIFGFWLTTIVAMENPDHKPSPGRQSERNSETAQFPNIQMGYENLAGSESWLPGILVLENLDDGRKIRIETGQEDSEILRVERDVVLYRVNDTIYQSKIGGNQLKGTTVVVKDEDVPEIHWAFWSK